MWWRFVLLCGLLLPGVAPGIGVTNMCSRVMKVFGGPTQNSSYLLCQLDPGERCDPIGQYNMMFGVSRTALYLRLQDVGFGTNWHYGWGYSTNSFDISLPSCGWSGPVVSNWYSGSIVVTNRDAVGHNYVMLTNGVAAYTAWVGPGGRAEFLYGDDQYMDVKVLELNSDGAATATWLMSIVTNGTVNPQGVYGGSALSGAVWEGGTNGVAGGSVGEAAIYDAVVKLGAQEHADLARLEGVLRGLSPEVQVSVTNPVSVSVSNSFIGLSTNDYGWAREVAGAAAGGLTNGMVVTSSGAEGAAAPYYADGVASLEGLMGDFVGPSDPGLGSGVQLEIPLGVAGYSLVFDPFSGELGTMWDVARRFFSWLLFVAYLMRVAKESMEFLRLMAQSRGTVGPSANISVFGVGADWGHVLIPVLVVAVLALLATALGYLVTTLVSLLPVWHSEFVAGPFGSGAGGAVGLGIELLKRVIPFGVVFQLVVAYVLFRLGMLKAGVVVMFCMRALPAH